LRDALAAQQQQMEQPHQEMEQLKSPLQQIGYGWWRQEQDSILASFAESEQRTPTNILENRIYVNYKLRSNTIASCKSLDV
jgi:hypothetical protein